MTDEKIIKLLKKKQEIEESVASYIQNQNLRFSDKKFVADLGEYYFYINMIDEVFSELHQEEKSNAECDFKGVLKPEFALEYNLPQEKIRIEIKTRKFQKGQPHLFGIHPTKFDIWGFVALDKYYRCYYIGLIKNDKIKPDNQNRIIFKNNLKFWPDRDYIGF